MIGMQLEKVSDAARESAVIARFIPQSGGGMIIMNGERSR